MTGWSHVMQSTVSEELCSYTNYVLANVYYSYPSNRRGILRAVLSSEEAKCLLKEHSAHYTGQQFPTMSLDPRVEVAILLIFEEEANEECRAGLYLFHDDIMQVEEEIHSCHAKSSLVT